jgi:hypothetical protein
MTVGSWEWSVGPGQRETEDALKEEHLGKRGGQYVREKARLR